MLMKTMQMFRWIKKNTYNVGYEAFQTRNQRKGADLRKWQPTGKNY